MSEPTPSDKEIYGKCCSCGYEKSKETPCPKRDDKTHCVLWWDGPIIKRGAR